MLLDKLTVAQIVKNVLLFMELCSQEPTSTSNETATFIYVPFETMRETFVTGLLAGTFDLSHCGHAITLLQIN